MNKSTSCWSTKRSMRVIITALDVFRSSFRRCRKACDGWSTMSINQDLTNASIGLVVGGGVAYGMAGTDTQEERAVNLIMLGLMIWLLMIVIK